METSEHYFSKPVTPTGRGILVLHAWWGLNSFIRGICDRLSQQGYLALAPDLYHGAVALTIEDAQRLRTKLKKDVMTGEILSAERKLRELCATNDPRIGVLGFSLGGHWALWLAEKPDSSIAATIVFYSARGGDYSSSLSAFQFHLAETDEYVGTSTVKKLHKHLRTAGKIVEFHTYAGTSHWFFENDRPEAYQPGAAELAWGRVLSFLNQHV